MVRFKNRYLVFELDFKDKNVDESLGANWVPQVGDCAGINACGSFAKIEVVPCSSNTQVNSRC